MKKLGFFSENSYPHIHPEVFSWQCQSRRRFLIKAFDPPCIDFVKVERYDSNFIILLVNI